MGDLGDAGHLGGTGDVGAADSDPGTVEIPTGSGLMPTHVARPEGAGPWPAVVVIHDALGMTTDLRNQAAWLADGGYLAAAPDLFFRGGRRRCLFGVLRAAAKREGTVFEDLEAVRSWLGEADDSTGRVGVIGFCMGGGFAVLLAARGGYGASSVNYGGVPKDAPALLAGACPIVGSFGGRDRTLAKAPGRLATALAANGIAHDVVTYPGAGHSFMNDHTPSEEPRWVVVLGALAGMGYDATAADDARRRILAFFDRYLKG